MIEKLKTYFLELGIESDLNEVLFNLAVLTTFLIIF